MHMFFFFGILHSVKYFPPLSFHKPFQLFLFPQFFFSVLHILTNFYRFLVLQIHSQCCKFEIQIHSSLKHPNIVQLIDYESPQRPDNPKIRLVLEYVSGGTLYQRLASKPLKKHEVWTIFKGICEAVLYLHSKDIIHRDIRVIYKINTFENAYLIQSENILLTADNEPKLCDFGFAIKDRNTPRRTICGTYEYMAPEMLVNSGYDKSVDVWALGILFFEMIEGRAPFQGTCEQEVYESMKNTHVQFSERFGSDQIDLIRSILRVNPLKRPTAAEILKAPYFNRKTSQNNPHSDTMLNKARKHLNKSANQLHISLGAKNEEHIKQAICKYNNECNKSSKSANTQATGTVLNMMHIQNVPSASEPIRQNPLYHPVRASENMDLPCQGGASSFEGKIKLISVKKLVNDQATGCFSRIPTRRENIFSRTELLEKKSELSIRTGMHTTRDETGVSKAKSVRSYPQGPVSDSYISVGSSNRTQLQPHSSKSIQNNIPQGVTVLQRVAANNTQIHNIVMPSPVYSGIGMASYQPVLVRNYVSHNNQIGNSMGFP